MSSLDDIFTGVQGECLLAIARNRQGLRWRWHVPGRQWKWQVRCKINGDAKMSLLQKKINKMPMSKVVTPPLVNSSLSLWNKEVVLTISTSLLHVWYSLLCSLCLFSDRHLFVIFLPNHTSLPLYHSLLFIICPYHPFSCNYLAGHSLLRFSLLLIPLHSVTPTSRLVFYQWIFVDQFNMVE